MPVYIFTFVSSLLFLNLALNFREKSKKKYVFFSAIAIFIPCLIAALRDLSIGTDTIGYQHDFYLYAKSSSGLLNFFYWTGSREYLYLIVTFFSQFIFKRFEAVLFFNELLVILPIFIALTKTNKNKKSILCGMFIFYTYFYNLTFNMARQSIALAFTILAFSFFEEKNIKKSIFFVIVASLFHNSALIVIPLIVIGNIMKKNNKLAILISIVTIFIVTFVSLNIGSILVWMSKYTNLKYSSFLDAYFGKAGINKIILFFWLILIGINLLFKNVIKKITSNNIYYFMCILITLISSYASTLVMHSDRIFYYFYYPYLFLILPKISENLQLDVNKKILNVIIISLFAFYWFYTIVFKNFNMTYPYMFG